MGRLNKSERIIKRGTNHVSGIADFVTDLLYKSVGDMRHVPARCCLTDAYYEVI